MYRAGSDLERMNSEAAETDDGARSWPAAWTGRRAAILEEAQATKNKASEMMSTYLDADSDALDGFEFLTMAEAGEVGHWSVLKVLAEAARSQQINELVEWALPIQERHFAGVKQASLKLSPKRIRTNPPRHRLQALSNGRAVVAGETP